MLATAAANVSNLVFTRMDEALTGSVVSDKEVGVRVRVLCALCVLCVSVPACVMVCGACRYGRVYVLTAPPPRRPHRGRSTARARSQASQGWRRRL